MWGSLCTELTNFSNFNVGFSTHKSEILIHLSQWQYWWWFWFSFFWTFYFFVILRVIKHRVFKMNLRLNTSFRSRGKWGDYLVTVIPLSWCVNILLNSNFILRMIEWQAESGSLILRIHGKQWYWVYKFDLSNLHTVASTAKQVGSNRWVHINKTGSFIFDSYLESCQIRINSESEEEYFTDAFKKNFNPTSTKTIQNREFVDYVSWEKKNIIKGNEEDLDIFNWGLNNNMLDDITKDDLNLFSTEEFNKTMQNRILKWNYINDLNNLKKNNNYNLNLSMFKDNTENLDFSLVEFPVSEFAMPRLFKETDISALAFYENNDLDDKWEVYSNLQVNDNNKSLVVINNLINNLFMENVAKGIKQNLFKINVKQNNDIYEIKPEENVDFWVIKQKRYKRKQNIKSYNIHINNENEEGLLEETKNSFKSNRYLKNNQVFVGINELKTNNAYDLYNTIKINRKRSENFSINMSRRLLRTTRTLVLPAFTNITIIANSYDVVHSWFIPGLGLKIDCVPGKSTHHSLYIDNVGLYYGQCAEICGRYHHHMPIRICALPFEHFLIWWASKGINKFNRTKEVSDNLKNIENFKYNW